MEIIKNNQEIEKIVDWKRRLRFNSVKALNTPWARDKYGRGDTVNLALFIELKDNEGESYYWLISEAELGKLNKSFDEVKSFNLMHNSQGREFQTWKEE